MDDKAKTFSVFLIIGIIVLSAAPTALSDTLNQPVSSYFGQYSVLNQNLHVSVQPSLYVYYSNLTHTLPNDSDYNRFITPQTVQPIADAIVNLTKDKPNFEEDFANAVLDFVHQIPYNITGAMYPVETLVNNQGDCGAVSLLAASIMKAGGLDVVLFKYTGEVAHMNVGVYLPDSPVEHSFLAPTVSFQYENKTYWAAEATPKGNWRVGDQSIVSPDAQPIIIPLNNTEQTSPGYVSCSFLPLTPSSITLNVLPHPQTDQSGRSLVLSGNITPANNESQISLYINKNSASNSYFTAPVNASGWYTYTWNLTSAGTYYVSASSSVGDGFSGADSDRLVVFVGPESLLQFQRDNGNYIIGVSLPQGLAVRPYMGLNNYLSYPLKSNVSVSYDFLVLPTGRSPTDIQTKSTTIPASSYIVHDRSSRLQRIIQVPAKTVTVPVGIPPGQEVLALPNDFNKTINNKFCFIFQNDSQGNYALNAQAFNEYETSSLTENNSDVSSFVNITQAIRENTAYKVTATLSENGITTSLLDQNGETIHDSSAQNQLVLLVADNVDSAIVLKDLHLDANANIIHPAPSSINSPPVHLVFPINFVATIIGSAAALILAGAIISFKKKKTGN